MFASFIQIVTLLAFTAHAVLGCCWHHAHAVVDLTTQTATAHQSDCAAATAHTGCGQSSTSRTQTNCSHRHAAKVQYTAQGNPDQHVNQNCCSSPHHPFHHCSSGRCSYMSAKVLTWNPSVGASLEGFVTICALKRQLPSVHAQQHFGQRPFFLSPPSPGERCVHLQTWQI